MSGLSSRDVRVRLGGREVVSGLTLDLAAGNLVAIVGPNGAGKTSLLRALVGLLPWQGEATLGGTSLRAMSAGERARRIAYLPQGHEVHWPLPARDIVALGRMPHGSRDPARLSPADEAAIAEAMRLTETDAFADRPVTQLSGGERARVALARVLAVGAPLILADEPIAALDPRHQLDVMAGLHRQAVAGALVIVVTHDLGLAARFAQTIVVMKEGRLVTAAPPAEAFTPEILAEVFAITAFTAEHDGLPIVVPWS